jgi:hypothetical protein
MKTDLILSIINDFVSMTNCSLIKHIFIYDEMYTFMWGKLYSSANFSCLPMTINEC